MAPSSSSAGSGVPGSSADEVLLRRGERSLVVDGAPAGADIVQTLSRIAADLR